MKKFYGFHMKVARENRGVTCSSTTVRKNLLGSVELLEGEKAYVRGDVVKIGTDNYVIANCDDDTACLGALGYCFIRNFEVVKLRQSGDAYNVAGTTKS